MKYSETGLKTYLELADVTALRYCIADDSFEFSRTADENTESGYRGTLSAWEEECLNGKIDDSQKDNFRAFCSDLRAGKEKFQYSLSINRITYTVKCSLAEEDGVQLIYGTARAEKKKEDDMGFSYRRASDRDPMLDMLSKRAIVEYAKRTMGAKDCPTTYIVIFDLDNFKVVNDSYGHLFGDEVLITVTDIIKNCVGKRGMIGRLGGDEIMIVTKGVPDKAALRTILKDIRMAVENAFANKLEGMSITCSMGAAAYPDHAGSYTEVAEIADKMLYLAKDKGRNRYLIYTPELHQDLIRKPASAITNGTANTAVTYDKIGIMQYMLEEFLIRCSSSNGFAFTQVGNAFKLNGILAVYGKGEVCFRWTPEGISNSSDNLTWIPLTDDFYGRFDENNLYVVDGLYSLTKTNPELEKKLIERDVQSALFYCLKQKGKPDGYMMFAKKVQRQKWSEYEILALSTIAKIFELSIRDTK